MPDADPCVHSHAGLRSPLEGQECFGTPAGQGFAHGGLTVVSRDVGQFGEVGYGEPFHVAVRAARRDVDGLDSSLREVGARIGVSIPQGGYYVGCPFAEYRHSWLGDIKTHAGRMGLAIGVPIHSEGLSAVPSLSWGLRWARTSIEDFSESEVFGVLAGAVSVGAGRAFLRAGVDVTTLAGSDPVYSVGLGFSW